MIQKFYTAQDLLNIKLQSEESLRSLTEKAEKLRSEAVQLDYEAEEPIKPESFDVNAIAEKKSKAAALRAQAESLDYTRRNFHVNIDPKTVGTSRDAFIKTRNAEFEKMTEKVNDLRDKLFAAVVDLAKHYSESLRDCDIYSSFLPDDSQRQLYFSDACEFCSGILSIPEGIDPYFFKENCKAANVSFDDLFAVLKHHRASL